MFRANCFRNKKIINALRKSWQKMTPAGQAHSLNLAYGEKEKALIEKALHDNEQKTELAERSKVTLCILLFSCLRLIFSPILPILFPSMSQSPQCAEFQDTG